MDDLKGVRASFEKGCFQGKVKKEDFFNSRYYKTIFPTAEKMAEAWEWCKGEVKKEVKKIEVKKSPEEK